MDKPTCICPNWVRICPIWVQSLNPGFRRFSNAAAWPTHCFPLSTIQQRVLAYLFGQPARSFFATELIKLAGGGSGAVQRELARLADSGLVTVTRVGTQKHFQASPTSPIFAELCAIVQKTVGLVEPLREALVPLAKRITAAFVFGSVAKRSDTATRDIDVLGLSDSVDYVDVFAAL